MAVPVHLRPPGRAPGRVTRVASLEDSRPPRSDAGNLTVLGAGMTRQLLAFSRQQVLQLEELDANEIVQGTARLFDRLIGENVVLETALAAEPCVVRGDAAQLQQVLINLAVNARDAMPNGGRLVVSTSVVSRQEPDGAAPRELVSLTIADTGCGMTAEVLSHLFEPFFTTKARGKGTGLGLATVYGIVEQLNGRIDVQSAPGVGTTVRILLPALDRPAVPASAAAALAPSCPAAETILLVEDEPGVRDLAGRLLRNRGYRVLEASDGLAALDLARRQNEHIDLLLTDVVMPKLGGPALAEALAHERPGIRCLFMSGYPNGLPASETGQPLELLQKPFTAAELVARVRAALGGSPPA